MTREVTEAERLATVERTQTDHAKTISAYAGEFEKHDARLKALEETNSARREREIREEERDKAAEKWRDTMEADLKAVKADVAKMTKDIDKLGWRVLAAVGIPLLTAVLAWIFKGGLAG